MGDVRLDVMIVAEDGGGGVSRVAWDERWGMGMGESACRSTVV